LKEIRTALEKQRGIAADWTARGVGTALMKKYGRMNNDDLVKSPIFPSPGGRGLRGGGIT